MRETDGRDGIDETTGAVRPFDGRRVAAFDTSFNPADAASYRILGTKGRLVVDPAYEYAEGVAYELTVNGIRWFPDDCAEGRSASAER